nr:hypothetical protein [Mesorhizobium sp.]
MCRAAVFALLMAVASEVFALNGALADGGLAGIMPAAPSAAVGAEPLAPPAPGSPTALVRPFYEQFGLELDPAQRGNFIDPAKKVLDDAEALEKSGQGECLDPNMALDNAAADKAQIAASLKTLESVDGDQAKVVVAFIEDSQPHRLEWKLRKVAGAWKIANLLSVTGEWELSQYQCE